MRPRGFLKPVSHKCRTSPAAVLFHSLCRREVPLIGIEQKWSEGDRMP
jgi:hypothetical protein